MAAPASAPQLYLLFDIRDWIAPKAAALILRRTRQTVMAMVERGELRGCIYGGDRRRRVKIDPATVHAYKAWREGERARVLAEP